MADKKLPLINQVMLTRMLKKNADLYDIAMQGVRAYLGEQNNYSMEILIPGSMSSYTVNPNMKQFLLDNKIINEEDNNG